MNEVNNAEHFFKCSFVGVKKDRTQKSNLSRTKILERKFNEL